ncbi:MAG: molybdopterin molybdotransferase MoeA [Actinomycetales bacterium]|jgi:molybdopterin molybdotransferase|nr:molybdopterin molybdotransferase MoeA [Actinomycetales bacterium]
MRSVADQLSAVLAAAAPMAPLDVVLADADGCVLARDVVAERDVPALDLAAYDGYAVRGADAPPWQEARLPVVDDAPVGAGPVRHVPGTAVLVAAGAPLPLGADTVVPLEQTDRGRAHVQVRAGVDPGAGIRRAGQDARAGATVLAAGTRVGPRHLALAAAVGCSRLWVHPTPRVVVVTVGDELVEPGRRLPDGGVHDADAQALVAAAREAGASAVRVGPVADDRAELREVVADQLVRADLLLLVGGLSAGPFDTVGDVLAGLPDVRIDQLALTPGGRMAFGHAAGDGADARVLVAGIPGHPVAALVAFELFLRPALRTMAGRRTVFRPSVRAAVTHPWASPAGLTQAVPASVVGSPAEGYTVTALDPDAPSLAALARANALVVVPEETTTVHAGDVVPCVVLEP